jgi:hypothetical protein
MTSSLLLRTLLCTGSIVTLGCSANREVPRPADSSRPRNAPSTSTPGGRVTLTRLASGELPFLQSSGIRDSLRAIIRDSVAFADLWTRAHAPFGEKPTRPTIDFGREMIIATALGTRPTGGYGIYLDSAATVNDTLVVYVRTVRPGATCGTTAALTQPVDLARAPRLTLPTRFVERATTHECG